MMSSSRTIWLKMRTLQAGFRASDLVRNAGLARRTRLMALVSLRATIRVVRDNYGDMDCRLNGCSSAILRYNHVSDSLVETVSVE